MKSTLLNRAARLLTTATLAATLTACTGTTEPFTIVNLVVADRDRTVRFAATTPEGATTLPPQVNDVQVTDLVSLENGEKLAVIFTDRIELRASDGLSVLRTLPLPAVDLDGDGLTDFKPCYRKAAVNPDTTRFIVYSDPGPTDTGALGCDRQLLRIQSVLVYDSDGGLVYHATLPVPTTDPDDTHVALIQETGYVSRVLFPGRTEIDTIRPVDNNSDPAPLLTQAFISDEILDLATIRDTVYAATLDGVRPVTPTGLGQPILPGSYNRLFGALNILAAWDEDLGQLVLRNATGNTYEMFGLDRLRDVVFTPDGFLYAVQPNRINRFDIVGFNLGRNVTTTNRTTIDLGVLDARTAAFTVPPQPPLP